MARFRVSNNTLGIRVLGTQLGHDDFVAEHSQTPECQPGQRWGQGDCWHATLRSAVRTRHSAFCASWAESLSMIKERHPVVAEKITSSFNNARQAGPCIQSAVLAAHELMGVDGFEVPSWKALANGFRPLSRESEDIKPDRITHGR